MWGGCHAMLRFGVLRRPRSGSPCGVQRLLKHETLDDGAHVLGGATHPKGGTLQSRDPEEDSRAQRRLQDQRMRGTIRGKCPTHARRRNAAARHCGSRMITVRGSTSEEVAAKVAPSDDGPHLAGPPGVLGSRCGRRCRRLPASSWPTVATTAATAALVCTRRLPFRLLGHIRVLPGINPQGILLSVRRHNASCRADPGAVHSADHRCCGACPAALGGQSRRP
mmetsp:Transcript_6866/g.19583  ORF Transcript_6866/g.19583 Transcript_6866/m.19583 type:complete len:223 (+) Transcript_6866:549-1217(+)